MVPIKIIRIEHPDSGMGLWRAEMKGTTVPIIEYHSSHDIIQERHSNSNIFPTLYSDKQLFEQVKNIDSHNYYFAFNSLEYFRKALTEEEIKECIEVLGFKVFILEVTDYYRSQYQTMYRKSSILSKQEITFMFL